ncbi:hypothetical protein CHU98_g11587 [Xylaria longipes]|nr:hypothetical protein CHU98_g11587 [Xylaria longipes]
MASTEYQTGPTVEKEISTGADVNGGGNNPAVQRYDYGGNPLYHAHTGNDARLAAFGDPRRRRAQHRPLGRLWLRRSHPALGWHVVSSEASVEMAVGNTFGATALSSYGGFWLSYAIILTPAFNVLGSYSESEADTASVLGFFLIGWFIFTFIMLMLTLRSTVMFFSLFLTLDLAFLFLAVSEFAASNGNATASVGLQKAGGVFGLLAAFLAWYNAFAGIADTSNSFFIIPVFHFPWSEKSRETRVKSTRETV